MKEVIKHGGRLFVILMHCCCCCCCWPQPLASCPASSWGGDEADEGDTESHHSHRQGRQGSGPARHPAVKLPLGARGGSGMRLMRVWVWAGDNTGPRHAAVSMGCLQGGRVCAHPYPKEGKGGGETQRSFVDALMCLPLSVSVSLHVSLWACLYLFIPCCSQPSISYS